MKIIQYSNCRVLYIATIKYDKANLWNTDRHFRMLNFRKTKWDEMLTFHGLCCLNGQLGLGYIMPGQRFEQILCCLSIAP